MIRNTFSILNGIGDKLERRLWRDGILTWDAFLDSGDIRFLTPEKKTFFDDSLALANQKLDERNAAFFAKNVRRREHWRLFETFKGEAVCLDIETNGFQPNRGGYVTVVGLYDGYESRSLIAGENLTTDNLKRELEGYKCLITYYGASFDIPFLLKAFPGIRFDLPHFDLCYGARRLGFDGGLKKLEASLGIERDEDVKGMDGYDAVKLWDLARSGNEEARRLLLVYNREDTVNLYRIAEMLYPRLKHATGIEEYLPCAVH
ncbi:MAG TPA: ribonuclease H-like domain-containing protein [Thermodesulfovibrionales bacterium]|nr:ribonuclease H-like domain-containing protein [Thermodesulfovibrionales bacterium]